MDLSTIKAIDSIWVEIDQVEGLSFELAGPSHPVALKAQRERTDRMFKARKFTAKAREDAALDHLACRVLSWKGVEWEGAPLECTPENVWMILENPNLDFIKNQLLIALADDESFFSI